MDWVLEGRGLGKQVHLADIRMLGLGKLYVGFVSGDRG